ncbi:hypothetical protein ACWGIV_32500 [Streptomyces sp. NPDC054844]
MSPKLPAVTSRPRTAATIQENLFSRLEFEPRRHPACEGPFSPENAQLGVAHGLAGLLALFALTTRVGYTLNGQHVALDKGITRFTRWAQRHSSGTIGWPGPSRRPCQYNLRGSSRV